MRGKEVLNMKVGSMTVHEKIYWCLTFSLCTHIIQIHNLFTHTHTHTIPVR